MRHRLQFIDSLKAFLILLVILGHCIQTLDIDFDHNIVFRYIYSVHMPLFMFVSGFVSYKPEHKWDSIKKRFLQLVVPFFAWAIISMPISGNFNFNWLLYPDNALWFLWVLFWISTCNVVLSKVANRFKINEELLIGVVCLLFLSILFVNKLLFGYHLFAWYLPFYCAGILLRKHYQQIQPLLSQFRYPLILIFLISAFFWMPTEAPTFMVSQNQAIIFGYKFAVAMIGCCAIMSIAPKFKFSNLYINRLGGATLGVYAIHQPIIHVITKLEVQTGLTNIPLWLNVVMTFSITLLITIIIYKLLNLSTHTRFLFLGKN